MLEIPLNATVVCVDGRAGKSTHVIVDPRNRTVTHIVVKDDKNFAAQDRLIPIEHIVETTHDLIRLDYTLAELAKLTGFSSTRYVNYGYEDYAAYSPDYMGMGGPYSIPTASTANIPIVDESIPEGERALMQGARVEATDGTVGKVGELIVDQATGAITHFTLQEGHFWGKKEVTLPLTVVRNAEEDVVHLKLDKNAIKSLPAVPRQGKPDKGKSSARFEFIARVFDAPNKAAEALAYVQELQRQQHGTLKIHNSAILVKDAGGKLKITESGSVSPKKRSLIGAVAGGLLGALAGPVGIAIGAAAGAGLGRASIHWFDLGLPDEFLNRLKEYLQPNTSALILLVEHQYLNLLSETMAGMEGIVLQHTLTDAVVEQLLKEQGG
jgi:uncharacterized membrane protein/sporulation protein YlmC with PRC-barrel domain